MLLHSGFFGADDEARTRYLHLGKVALYQMSYIRIFSEQVVLYTLCISLSILIFYFFRRYLMKFPIDFVGDDALGVPYCRK